jgi:hypothetical protein
MTHLQPTTPPDDFTRPPDRAEWRRAGWIFGAAGGLVLLAEGLRWLLGGPWR